MVALNRDKWPSPCCGQRPQVESVMGVWWECGVFHDIDGYGGTCSETGWSMEYPLDESAKA